MTLTSCQFSIPSPKVQPAALQGFAFSVLHMQVHLTTPICSSLRGVVNILASGRAPVSVSKFVAGGSLIALVKNKEGHPLDIRPIVVGEALRRLTGKCLCIITKPKASDFFTPFQYGVAGPDGAEKVIHGVRSCIQEHWKDDNFTVCKVDMSNAFKPCVSAGSPGGMCSPFPRASSLGRLVLWFPPYVMAPSWTIKFRDRGPARGSPGSTSLFLSSAQVGVIHRTGQGLSLSFNRWYLDDEIGPSSGLFINVSECELFGHGDLSSFPPEMKVKILGAPIGDPVFCAKFLAQKCADAVKLLSQLAEVVGATCPFHTSFIRRWGLALFDKDVRQCFSECTALDTSDIDWMQAQLSLIRGGLGLRSLSCHSVAAYLASLSSSVFDKSFNLHLSKSIVLFNEVVPAADSITEELLATSNLCQHTLCSKIEDQQFRQLFDLSSPAYRARLLSVSSRHAASWLTVIPSPDLNLHLEPNEFQVAIKWLDLLGHHALMCKHEGDVVLRHNSLRNVFVESCHRACLGGQVKVGSGHGLDRLHCRPADVLVNKWHLGKPAAFDLTVASPLKPTTLTEAGVRCGSSALFAEARKHNANDSKCAVLGWVCIPLAVESYGCWGTEAQQSFSRLAARLAIQMGCNKSQATTIVYQRLSLSLVRANARALLSRTRFQQSEEGD
ncbi:hypothetical protein EMCRGX_G003574 [Ephydatia muelleri]